MKVECAFCRQAVQWKKAGAHRQVTGWEEIRRGGGANKIVARKVTGEWAHSWCIPKDVVIEGQERMFE